MNQVKTVILLLMLFSAGFAAAGAGWNASSVAATKCGADVQAVYICSNQAVKVVSPAGSKFYKPDGSVLSCPDESPGQMGGECMQFLAPDPCTTKITCQATVIQNQTVPATPISNASVGQKTAPETAPVVAPVNTTAAPTGQPMNQSEADVSTPAPDNFDFSMGNLALVVLLLGAVAVVVLFSLFKNSISE